MKILLPLLFALTAAVGNALFALGQKQSAAVGNGLAFVACSALLAMVLALASAPLVGPPAYAMVLRDHFLAIVLSGVGLYLTYLGFNLLYSKYGASYYILYAVLSIVTTAILLGVFWLKEPFNLYHKLALVCAMATVILFSMGQGRVQ